MSTMFEQTTIEMARQAALAINEFMAHWNDRLEEGFRSDTFHGAKVTRLSRLLATPAYENAATLWEAHFDRDCTNLCFQIRDGIAHFPDTRTFIDVMEPPPDSNQRLSEQLEPDQISRF